MPAAPLHRGTSSTSSAGSASTAQLPGASSGATSVLRTPAMETPAGGPAQANNSSASTKQPMRALFLHTHDVARSLKPSVDGELANALHETLHFALDGREEDWGVFEDAQVPCGNVISRSNGASAQSVNAGQAGADKVNDEDSTGLPPARPGFFPTGNLDRPYISYAWDERNATLSLPNPVVIANPTTQDPCSPENRSDFEVTAKFFYLEDEEDLAAYGNASDQHRQHKNEDESLALEGSVGNGAHAPDMRKSASTNSRAVTQMRRDQRFPEEYVHDAIQRLGMTTSLITIDTFVVSFPSLHLDSLQPFTSRLTNSEAASSNLGSTAGHGSGSISAAAPDSLNAGETPEGGLPSGGCGAAPGTDLGRSAEFTNNRNRGSPPVANSGNGSGNEGSGSVEVENSDGFSSTFSDEQEERLREDIEAVKSVWESISPNPQLLSLGLADFSLPALATLFESFVAPESPSTTPGYSGSPSAADAPSSARKPKLVTINVKDNPCTVDKDLSSWCDAQEIQLIAHNDQRDILPARTLPALLQEFHDDLPRPVPKGKKLKPRWILKYSTVIKERGILADKGYIVYVEWV